MFSAKNGLPLLVLAGALVFLAGGPAGAAMAAGEAKPEAYEFDAAGKAFAKKYVDAMKTLDFEILREMIHPDVSDCLDDANRDFLIAKNIQINTPEEFSLKGYVVAKDAVLPLEGFVSYPVRPSHVLVIEYKELQSADRATIIRHVVKEDDTWSFVVGCPSEAAMPIVKAMQTTAISGKSDETTAAEAVVEATEEKGQLAGIKKELKGDDARSAARRLQTIAGHGDAEAQKLLAGLYAEGRGVIKNQSLALYWYRRAGDGGDAEAQFHTGQFYEMGKGRPPSVKTALDWYLRAAEQDYAVAQAEVGFIYRDGRGAIRPNAKLAKIWLSKAAEQGSEDAAKALERMKGDAGADTL